MHLENLPFNYEEAVAVLLFVIGFCMLLFSRNLIKKVIGLDIMDSGVFSAAGGPGLHRRAHRSHHRGRRHGHEPYVNPIPRRSGAGRALWSPSACRR